MASFYGYVVLVIGLSLLLAMAGVETTSSHLMNKFITINSTSPEGNFTVDTSLLNKDSGGSDILVGIWAVVGIFAAWIVIRSGLGGIFGIAESVKVILLYVLLPFMLMDFVSILNYLNGVDYLNGVIKIIAFVVYIPITIGMIISALDFLGGGK